MSESSAWSVEKLEDLPAKNGFRQRGMEMTRLETFADAAFAFAVTLLVVGGGDSVPTSFDEMIQALKQVPAFAASFANIMLFWYAHHIWSRRFGLEDTASVLLSLLLVFLILIYVYPLKAIYSGAIDFFTGGYLESYFHMETGQDVRSLFIVFGLGYAVLSGVIVLLNRHALSVKAWLSLSEAEIFDTQSEMGSWVISAAVAMISVLLAAFVPDGLIFLAGVFYGVLGIVMPLYAARRARRRQTDVATSVAAG